MKFISYAQNQEDVLLYRVFKGIKKGFYIDVRTHFPSEDSVTKNFCKLGWQGINVEPDPEIFSIFEAEGSRDSNLKRELSNKKKAPIQVASLSDLSEKHAQKEVDFLNVNVGGGEYNVIISGNWKIFRPKVVLCRIVNYLGNKKKEEEKKLNRFFLDHEYQFVYFDGLNNYYVAKEHSDLGSILALQPNVLDSYLTRVENEKDIEIAKLHRKLTEKETVIFDLSRDQDKIKKGQREHSFYGYFAKIILSPILIPLFFLKKILKYSSILLEELGKKYLPSLHTRLVVCNNLGRKYTRKKLEWIEQRVQRRTSIGFFITKCVQLISKNFPTVFDSLKEITFLRKIYHVKIDKWRREKPKKIVTDKVLFTCKKQQRIFIDVSHITDFDHGSGIQRVVKEIVKALYSQDREEIGIYPVQLIDKELYIAKDFLELLGLTSFKKEDKKHEFVEFKKGDTLLMLDSSWEDVLEFDEIFKRVKFARASVVTVVYDLILLTRPECFPRGRGTDNFNKWLRIVIKESKQLICISKSVKNQVLKYIKDNYLESLDLKVDYFHLGSNFEVNKKHVISRRIENIIQTPFLLMVGRLEPHKCHELAVNAMEELWKKGVEVRLCIAGKKGALVRKFIKKLRKNFFLQKQLFFIEEPGDNELSSLYSHASGLLALSKEEGFGLPLVEASQHGLPIVCSDIPVFHEVATTYATYVKLEDFKSVAHQIETWWDRFKVGAVPDTSHMPRLTWEESAQNLLKVICEGIKE